MTENCLKRVFRLLFLLLGTGVQATAQNLVPNPSFEEYEICPQQITQTRMAGPLNWYQPTAGSADYFNACAKKIKICGVPLNKLGYQEARTGNAYCGIICYINERTLRNYREYLETKLNDRLQKGHTYCLQLHVSLAESSTYAVYNMDVVFSRFAVKGENDRCLDSLPSASFVCDTAMNDVKAWKEIRMSYKAAGGERFMTFGNFHNDRHTRKLKLKPQPEAGDQSFIQYPEAYYYIDDVCLKDVTDTVSCVCDFSSVLVLKDTVMRDSLDKRAYALNQHLVLKNIYFETDKSRLLPASYAELNKLLAFLQKHRELQIEIDGHTDNQGTDEHNVLLSEARAKAVADYLVSKGLRMERIRSAGFGRMQPIATNETEEGRQLNRRVEFIIRK